MKVQCKFCQSTFESLLIEKEQAVAEVTAKLTHHIMQRHKETTIKLNQHIQKATFGIGSWLILTELSKPLDDRMINYLQHNLDSVMEDLRVDSYPIDLKEKFPISAANLTISEEVM